MGRSATLHLLALALLLHPGVAASEIPQARPSSPSGHPDFVPAVASLSPDSPERRALDLIRLGKSGEALQAIESALPAAGADSLGRLHWLASRCTPDAPTGAQAREHLRKVADSHHPLARWATLEIAQAVADDAPEATVEALSPLLGGWAGAKKARNLHAIALYKLRRLDEAEPRLRALVDESPTHLAAGTAAMPLAKLLTQRGDEASLLEALGLYRRVATRAPLSHAGKRAMEQEAQVLAALPKAVREAHMEVPFEDALQHSMAMFRVHRYGDAADGFKALANKSADDPTLQCRARLHQGRALLRKRDRRAGSALLEGVAAECTDLDIKASARFNAARAHVRLGEPQAGIEQYRLLQQEAPKHRLADDALLRAALAAEDVGDEAGMLQRLQSFVDRYPTGDMRPEALFTLAWKLRSGGKLEEALAVIERLITEGADERDEGLEGRALYWRARILGQLGQTHRAHEGYAMIVRARPLSYHAQQALTRLSKDAPAEAKILLAELGTAEHAPLRFKWRPELDHPAFQSAVSLLRVGEQALARAELNELGVMDEGTDADMLWIVAALFDATGAHADASNLVRSRLHTFMTSAPSGRTRALWRIAFPDAYSPLIEEAAGEAGVPSAYVRAVAREESAFNPDAVSSAHAYGLIQLIEPTARAHAKALGLPSNPAALRQPAINLRIGSSFIHYLWDRYRDNPAIVPAAYNAGHGAADRWLRAQPEQELDEWIENIPFTETRRYTRRVLQSYGIYAWLQDGALPPLPTSLPKR